LVNTGIIALILSVLIFFFHAGVFMVLRFPTQPTRQQMEQVLQIFLSRTSTDPALKNFALDKFFSIQYILSDLELEFFLIFDKGEVMTGMGAAPEPADVRLRADLEVLNSIFTGRTSPTRSLVNGKLSFSGDLRRMSEFQRIQPDLAHLYRAACRDVGAAQEVGQDNDLAGVYVPNYSLNGDLSDDPRLALVQAVHKLYQGHLVTSSGGNLSVRIPGARQAWITPYQLYLENLTPDDMVRIDFDGNTLDEGAPAPSEEFSLHTEIYKARPDVQAVIHAHSQYATILSMSEKSLTPMSVEAASISELPRVSFSLSNKADLASGVVKALGNNSAVLLQNHGVVIAAYELSRAILLLEAIERASQMILQHGVMGKRPPTMPREIVKTLREMGTQYNGSNDS
jgi:ribulose-5-phosphate 4-epimerase/fuculose-1-phosphate aldolase/putative sterol carrier protein